MASQPGDPRVLSPPPVYYQQGQQPQAYAPQDQQPQAYAPQDQQPQAYAPQVNPHSGMEGPQVMPNPQFQVNVHPQHVYPAGVQMQMMPTGNHQLRPIPIGGLNRGSAPVQCPVCGAIGLTAISFQTGESTHLWAALFCFVLCLGCIPYMVESWKDVLHKCTSCGAHLATWRRGGGIEVHIH